MRRREGLITPNAQDKVATHATVAGSDATRPEVVGKSATFGKGTLRGGTDRFDKGDAV